ncbi:AAA-like domain-containing protein [Kaistella pullorum]|uniref:AAA-like domain-containing protein n=1 Tax=Kaistella pullorum TaxID=2763074 RepID=A0ABR8WLI0_9FLAO|nr:AAA-like domain-containing protein [Kaistella pullorum]MBD8017935.1 AAA-like domain-containing protein [Kaistella pullorum]
MERILKNYTTIPDHLYVERQADYQLKNIIDEMQRPGYVLVARQMGKTNLLLNAKRNLESSKRLIIYIDLSNLYENEVDCYRNIIDTIIELNENIFLEITPNIDQIRGKNTPPHNEYLRSLLLILQKFDGDIVIILDEIDALKSKTYSDNIFAQIRSNYFSRTNYSELERLTYILSGVIEPTELIKDKNKSPFNIGEKIYLDDFSFEEHNTFIYKSKLQISNECSDHIFEWINGNPRMTFDICSEIEKSLLKGNQITNEIVDELIHNKYLIAFDVAPVDHIRELIKNDEELREAIKCIQSNKTVHITDEIKRKLYLFGIISSDFNSNLSIKNRIISYTTNIEWLNSLENEISYANAISKYSHGFYHEAIGTFEALLKENNSVLISEQIRYHIALCYYHLGDFETAIEYLDYEFQTDVEFDSRVFLALSEIKIGNINGLKTLEEIVSNGNTNSITFLMAILNVAINTPDGKKALDFLDLITAVNDNIYINSKELQELKTLSHFFKSNIYEKQEQWDESINENNIALSLSTADVRPILLLNKINILKILGRDTNDTKQELVNFIVSERLNFSEQNYYPVSFNRINLPVFFNGVLGSDTTAFDILFTYISTNLLKGEKECIDLLLKEENNIPELCEYLLSDKRDKLDTSQSIAIYRILSSRSSQDIDIVKFKLYIDEISVNIKDYILQESDYMFILNALFQTIHKKNFKNAITYSEEVLTLLRQVENNFSTHVSALAQYIKFIGELQLNFKIQAVESANKTLVQLDNIKEFIPEIIDVSLAASIRDQVTNIPFVRNNKIVNQNNNQSTLRNQIVTAKYNTGKIIKSKFKHIEKDLLDGKCIIIE